MPFKIIKKLRSKLMRFPMNNRGNIAMTFGLCLIPVVIAVGIAIDLNRALIVRERLSQAIDTAALALAATGADSMTEAQQDQFVQDFMDANYAGIENKGSTDPADQIANFKIGYISELDVEIDDDEVKITAQATVQARILGIIGIDTITVGSSTEVVRELSGLELAMVLDNTGSMSGSKIADLKVAALELVDILYGTETTPELLRIGLVPFSAGVNIGTDAIGKGWMDMDSTAAIAQAKFNYNPGQTIWDLFNQIPNRSWNGCVETRAQPFDTQDDEPTTPDTKWQPYFALDERDRSEYDNNYLPDSVSGTTNQRQKSVVKYNGTSVSSGSRGPGRGCSIPPVTPLTNVRSTIEAGINAMGASGYTHIPVGIAWGWRVLSSTEPFTEGKEYNDPDWNKAVVILTDGENTIDTESNYNYSNYSAYGHLRKARLGTTDASTFVSKINSKTSDLCTKMKGKNIRVYTITFQVNSSTVQNLMRNCATDPSLYFNSPSSSELSSAFKAIAVDLNNLRISK